MSGLQVEAASEPGCFPAVAESVLAFDDLAGTELPKDFE